MLFFGSQKMLGLFGGMGYAATVDMFHSKMGVPIPLAHLAIFGEFCGGLGLIFGLLTPIAAFGVACTMATATYMNMKTPGALSGIFTGATGADPSHLFFPASLFVAAVTIMILGAGAFSLDNRFFRKNKR